MNYGELKTAVAERIHRQEASTLAKIPGWLEIAHSRLQLDINNPENKKYLAIPQGTLTQVPNVDIWETPLPADCLRVQGVTVNAFWIDSTTPAQLQARSHNRAAHRSYFYAVQGPNLWLAPVAGDIGLWYKGSTPFFTSDTDTNRLSTDFPQLYIYGAVVEAQHSAQDTDELTKATALYDAELERVNKHFNRLDSGASPAVMAV